MDGDFVDFYAVLGVHPSATPEEIQEAYRRRSRKNHPDHSDAPDAEEKMKVVNRAFEVLNDPEKRVRYDEALQARKSKQEREQSSGYQPKPGDIEIQSRRRKLIELLVTVVIAWLWQELPRHWMRVALGIGMASLLIVGFATVFRRLPSEDQVANAKAAAEEKQIAEMKLQAEREELRRQQDIAAANRKQQSAIAKAKLRAVQAEGTKTLTLLKGMEAETETWGTQLASLLTSDNGRFIASDEASVRAFESIWNATRPTKADAREFRDQIEILLRPVDEELAKNETYFEPGEEVVATLRGVAGEIDKLVSESRVKRQQIERMLAVGEQAGRKAPNSLEQTIARLHTTELEEKNQILAATERKNQEAELEAAVKAKVQEGAGRVKLINEKESIAKIEAEEAVEREQLMKKARSSEIRSLLLIFISPGYVQPDGTVTGEKKPISYSKLYASGALEESNEGRSTLWRIMTAVKDKERPVLKTKTGNYDVLPDDRKILIRSVQAALKELGPTLVDLKMLEQ